jgi:dienelactone hydrolase
MATIIMFHSVYGLRRGVLDAAAHFRRTGHTVYTPDLYNGTVFDDLAVALKFAQEIGIPGMIQRTMAAVRDLPQDVVYAGFSNGGASAGLLAGTRLGAKGCLLFHAALPLQMLGITSWPKVVPVQVHYARSDPWRNQQWIDQLAADVRLSGASFEFFEYPVEGHLFTDPGLKEYDGEATALLLKRAGAFIDRVG